MTLELSDLKRVQHGIFSGGEWVWTELQRQVDYVEVISPASRRIYNGAYRDVQLLVRHQVSNITWKVRLRTTHDDA